MSQLEINGEWPKIEGHALQEMIVQEFWYDGTLEESANVVYLKVADQWYRLYFDYGIVFWRMGGEGLEDELASRSNDTGYPLIDLAERLCLKGSEISACVGQVVIGGSKVEFHFNGKKSVIFQCIDDVSSIKT